MAQQVARDLGSEARRARASALLRLVNSPMGVAALTLLSYGTFILVRLLTFNGDVTRFVIAGAAFIPPSAGAPVGLSVALGSTGYDGQFYYLLALNPFSAQPALAGAHFDLPTYRAQRILYPLLVWALSLGGRPSLVPALLVIVNLAAIVALGAVAAMFARRLGMASLWGGLVAFYPGLLVSLACDLGEPLALACALGSLLCASRRRWGWAALLLSLAKLARETTALIALALIVASALSRLTPNHAPRVPALRLIPYEQWRGGALAGLVSLGVALSWQVVLLWRWGSVGALAAGGNNIGIPLAGLFASLVLWATLARPAVQIVLYASAGYLLGLAEMVRRVVTRWRQMPGYIVLAWGLYTALALMLSVNVWDLNWNFLRAASEMGMLSLLLLLTAPLRLRRAALIATLGLWIVTFATVAPAATPTF
jgi:hypothetical protein